MPTPSRPSPSTSRRAPAGIVLGTGWDETALAGAPRPDPARPRRRRRRPAGLPGPGRRPLGHRVDRAARPRPGHHRPARLRPDGQLRLDAHHAARQAAYGAVGADQRRAAQRATLRRRRRAGHRQRARDGRPGGLRRRRPRRPARRWPPSDPGRAVARLLGRAGRARRAGRRPRARPGRRRRETCSATAPSARTPPRCSAPYTDRPDTAGTLRFDTGAAGRPRARLHRWPASRPASTASATPPSPRCSTRSAPSSPSSARPAVRACRHRLEHVEMVDRRGDRRGCATWAMVASVQPAFDAAWGGDAGMYVERLGVERALADQPVRRPGRRRRRPRPRQRRPGHPARPVGRRARRRRPPDAGLGPAPVRRLRRRHPRRLVRRPRRAPGRPAGRRAPRRTSPSGPTDRHPVRRPRRRAAPPPRCRRTGSRCDGTPIGEVAAMSRRSDPRSADRWSPGPGSSPRAAAQPVVDLARTAHHRVRRARRAAAGRAHRHRPGDGGGADRGPGAVGQPGGRRRPRPGRAWSPGVALPVWHALASGAAPDLHALAEQVGAGTARFELPTGADAERAREAARAAAAAGIARIDANRRRREELVAHARRPAAPSLDLPDRRHRRHPRGHPAGPGRRPGRRRRHRRHPLHRAVAARLRARGRHPHRLRRHLRHPGELPAHAGRPGRRQRGARPLRPADQLRVAGCACPRSPSWPGSSGWT